MGDVVPFIARVRSSGDWTAAERARLQELADSLTGAGGARVEAVFGATDSGDPWCVVTDENGDVLIHVARIDGKFVVHSAVDDALSEGADLHSALRERMSDDIEAVDDSAVVVPFSLGGRHAQTFLALVIATAFFYDTVGFADAAEAAPMPPAETPPADPPPPPLDIKTPTQERELAVQGAAFAEPTPTRPTLLAFAANVRGDGPASAAAADLTAAGAPQLASTPPPQPVEVLVLAQAAEARTVTGTSGDDELIGTAADERLVGGDGDDTLRGGGGNDILEGGAGDDRLELGAQVVAAGGEGADTFVIGAPAVLGQSETLLGVILDFRLSEGDQIISYRGGEIEVVLPPVDPDSRSGGNGGGTSEPPTTADFGPPPTSLAPTGGLGTTGLSGGHRVDVDVDGDGVTDGYVLVYMRGDAVGLAGAEDLLPHPYTGPIDNLFG